MTGSIGRTCGLLAALALVAGLVSAGQAIAAPSACPEHFLHGEAPSLADARLAQQTQALCYSEFAVLFSGRTRTPLWSADRLTSDRVIGAHRRRRSDAADTFHEEYRLPIGMGSTLADFARSGFDRGHMTPNGDMDNALAQGESFSLANIIPQDADNNRGLWTDVETAARRLAQDYGEAYVVTIPIFAGSETSWLRDRVAIPARLAKAIYVPSLNRAAAYLTENAPGRQWKLISVAQLRESSGIDAFPAVAEAVKQAAAELPDLERHEGHYRPSSSDGTRWRRVLAYDMMPEMDVRSAFRK